MGTETGRAAREGEGSRGSEGWDLADRLGDMISAHSPEGNYKFVSAAARELLGYESAELIGVWAYDLFHPDDVAKVGAAHRSALDGMPVTVSYRLRKKGGDYVWVETTSRVTTDGQGEVSEIFCCTRAIDHRPELDFHRSEEKYRHARRRLEQVLADESISPVYQPIVELDSGRVIAYEALSRFPGDPAHTPDRWFADAWDVGLGVPLELLAVRLAARALPRLPDDVVLHLNVSPATMASPKLLERLGPLARKVAVEITEHAPIDDFRAFDRDLASIRHAGGTVAIDDFGSGYASLRHILRIEPEWIKLDITLTERLDDSAPARALARCLVAFASEIGVRVIAEGIETEQQIATLADLGISHGQGFHLGRPAALEQALA